MIKKIFCVSLIISSLLTLGAIYIWAPVCKAKLELANGNMTYMKCHYTAACATLLAIILLVIAIENIIKFHVTYKYTVAAVGLLLILITFHSPIGFGFCGNGMNCDACNCNATAWWIRSSGLIAVLSSFVSLFKVKD